MNLDLIMSYIYLFNISVIQLIQQIQKKVAEGGVEVAHQHNDKHNGTKIFSPSSLENVKNWIKMQKNLKKVKKTEKNCTYNNLFISNLS
jgi:hypothetical protein